MDKAKFAKMLSAVVSIMFIVIGIAHLAVHFTDLTTTDVETLLDSTIPVMGNEESVWKMWQGYSFMMGVCCSIIGFLVLIPIIQLSKGKFPLISHGLVMIVLLGTISYSGYAYFTEFQLFGGLFGMILQLISVVITLKNQK